MGFDRNNEEIGYTEEQVKKAFWKTFHKSGEHFFRYSMVYNTEKDCNESTDGVWQEFLANLLTESI